MNNSSISGDNRQFRSVFSQYGQYREKIFQLLQERVRKPAAQASLALVGTLTLIAVLGLAVLRPTLMTVSSLIKEIHDEQKLVEALDDKFRALVTVQGLLEDMKEDLPRVEWAVPGDQEFQVFAKEVEVLAKERSLTAVEISQAGFKLIGGEGTTNNDRVKFMEVWISMGGSEEAVRNFLSDLIKMDRLVLLKSVDVSSVPKDRRQDEPYQVKGTLTMEIMYSPENSENSESQKIGLSENQIAGN